MRRSEETSRKFPLAVFSAPLRGPIGLAIETDEDVWEAFCLIGFSPEEAFLILSVQFRK